MDTISAVGSFPSVACQAGDIGEDALKIAAALVVACLAGSTAEDMRISSMPSVAHEAGDICVCADTVGSVLCCWCEGMSIPSVRSVAMSTLSW